MGHLKVTFRAYFDPQLDADTTQIITDFVKKELSAPVGKMETKELIDGRFAILLSA